MDNLIFDGNYILHKNVHSLFKMNVLYGELFNSLIINLDRFANDKRWKHKILVSDSRKKSWRTEISNLKYKDGRVINNDIDWKWVYETYADFKKYVSEKYDFTVYEYDKIEGDDYIASLVNYYNKKNQSNLIIASDHDLLQLVKYNINSDKCYINCMLTDIIGKEKFYFPEGSELWIEKYNDVNGNDIFNLSIPDINIDYFNLLKNKYTEIQVNNYEELFKKIIQGDKSDNIKSIYETYTKTGKPRGIGKATAAKAWLFYNENISSTYKTADEQFLDDIILSISKVKKLDRSDETVKIIKNNIRHNIRLIELKNKHFPDWVNIQIMEDILNNE